MNIHFMFKSKEIIVFTDIYNFYTFLNVGGEIAYVFVLLNKVFYTGNNQKAFD